MGERTSYELLFDIPASFPAQAAFVWKMKAFPILSEIVLMMPVLDLYVSLQDLPGYNTHFPIGA
jgi:hypothetical protein